MKRELRTAFKFNAKLSDIIMYTVYIMYENIEWQYVQCVSEVGYGFVLRRDTPWASQPSPLNRTVV